MKREQYGSTCRTRLYEAAQDIDPHIGIDTVCAKRPVFCDEELMGAESGARYCVVLTSHIQSNVTRRQLHALTACYRLEHGADSVSLVLA